MSREFTLGYIRTKHPGGLVAGALLPSDPDYPKGTVRVPCEMAEVRKPVRELAGTVGDLAREKGIPLPADLPVFPPADSQPRIR